MERKTAAKFAKSVLYEDVNDIDVYVEDLAPGYKKIYKELLRRAFEGNFKIEEIFPLGESRNVIQECEKAQNLDDDRRKLFIIDGDFYLLNENRPKLDGLYILNRYCIENYLLDGEVWVEIAHQEDNEKDLEEVAKKIDYAEWKRVNETLLVELFIIYSITFKFLPEEQTVKYKVTKLCKDDSGIICNNKVKERIDFLTEKLLLLLGKDELEKQISKRRSIINLNADPLAVYVSGKHYLFPLMKLRVRSAVKFTPTEVSLMNRLSQKCNINELKDIKKHILDKR